MSSNPLSNLPPLTPTSGMPVAAKPGRLKPVDPLALLRRHAVLLVITSAIGVGLGVAAHYGLKEWIPQFTSLAQYKIYRVASDASSVAQPAGADPVEAASFIEQQAAWIQSPEILDQFLQREDVRSTRWFQIEHGSDLATARKDLEENMLNVSAVPRSSTMQIRLSSPYEEETQPLLQSLSQVYLLAAQRATEGIGGQMRDDARRRRDEAKATVDDYQGQFIEGMRVLKVGGLDTASIAVQTSMGQRAAVRAQLLQEQAKLRQLRSDYAQADAPATPNEELQIDSAQRDVSASITYYENQRSQMVDVEGKGERHPLVQAADSALARLRAQKAEDRVQLLQQIRSSQLGEAERRVAELTDVLGSQDVEVERAERSMADYANAKQQVTQLQLRLEQARGTLADRETRLTEAEALKKHPFAARVDPYIYPSEPKMTFPQMARVVPIVAVLTLGLMGGLLFLREMLDQRVRSPQDVNMLGDTELLGMLPHASEDPSGATPVERVVERHPSGLMAESYRQVRAAVLVKMDRRGYRTLLLTGTQPGVGTSVVTHNLAASLAHQGRKVVVVDANFRRPAQAELLDVPGGVGLVDVLKNRVSLRNALQRVPGMSLWVLPAGDCHDAAPELMEHQGFRDLLAELEGSFDVVVLDAAPALLTSEARLLTKHVDAVAVVVQAGRDARGMVQRTLKRLDGQRADVLGVVLNGVRAARGGYYRKSYRAFYDYHREAQAPDRRSEPIPAVAVGEEAAAAHPNGNGHSGGGGDANGRGGHVGNGQSAKRN